MIAQLDAQTRKKLDTDFGGDKGDKMLGDLLAGLEDSLVIPAKKAYFAKAMIWRGDDRGIWIRQAIETEYAYECFERALERIQVEKSYKKVAKIWFESGLVAANF